MRVTDDGVLKRIHPPRWLRGVATYDRGWIELDPSRAEEYSSAGKDLLFDFLSIERPADAIAFVRHRGLLWHGAGADEFRERYDDWRDERLTIENILRVSRVVEQVKRGDREAMKRLRESRGRVQRKGDLNARPMDSDDDLVRYFGDYVTRGVNRGLAGAEEQIEQDHPGIWSFTIRPPTLLAYVYHQVSALIVQRVPLESCASCGRFFTVGDPRQRYCSDRCSGRARYHRWAEKKRQNGGAPNGNARREKAAEG